MITRSLIDAKLRRIENKFLFTQEQRMRNDHVAEDDREALLDFQRRTIDDAHDGIVDDFMRWLQASTLN